MPHLPPSSLAEPSPTSHANAWATSIYCPQAAGRPLSSPKCSAVQALQQLTPTPLFPSFILHPTACVHLLLLLLLLLPLLLLLSLSKVLSRTSIHTPARARVCVCV